MAEYCSAVHTIALQRKNALFAGHDAGAQNWAILVSLIKTCKLNKIEPHSHLTGILTAIVNGHRRRRRKLLQCPARVGISSNIVASPTLLMVISTARFSNVSLSNPICVLHQIRRLVPLCLRAFHTPSPSALTPASDAIIPMDQRPIMH